MDNSCFPAAIGQELKTAGKNLKNSFKRVLKKVKMGGKKLKNSFNATSLGGRPTSTDDPPPPLSTLQTLTNSFKKFLFQAKMLKI